MATLYVGGRTFDGEKVLDGHAVLEESGSDSEPVALLLAHVRPRRIRRCSDERSEGNG